MAVRALVLDGGDRTPYLSRLVARLAQMGVPMHYAADPRFKDFDALGRAGVHCHAVAVRHKLDLKARRLVRRLLDEHAIPVLHTISSRDAYAGIKARGRRPVRVLVRRGAYPRISRFDPADRTVYGRRGADKFLAVSRDLARHIVGKGIAPERVATVYTGVWSDGLDPEPRDLRAEHGLDPSTPLLGLLGNWRPVKGFDLLLDALGRLAREDVPFHLLVAGSGYDRTWPSIRELGLEGRVALLGHEKGALAFLKGLDWLVMPSRIDALPRTVIEATVVGTPVIATRVGGIPEILDEGRCGVLVPPRDAQALAAAIRAAVDDPVPSRALAAAALARNRELFSVERSAREHAAIYDGA